MSQISGLPGFPNLKGCPFPSSIGNRPGEMVAARRAKIARKTKGLG
jgi:hypothetical protein